MTNRGSRPGAIATPLSASRLGLVTSLLSVAVAIGAGVVVNMAASDAPASPVKWASITSLILAITAGLASIYSFRSKESQRTRLVFISHAHADEAAARRVNEALREKGYETWLAEDVLLPGMDWEEEISMAVAKASAAVIIVSPNLSDSAFTTREMRSLLSNLRTNDPSFSPLVPVVVGQGRLPLELQQIQAIRLDEPNFADKLDYSLARILDRH